MNSEVSTALSTLEADPRNTEALSAIKRQAESAANGEREALATAVAAARAQHTERGEPELALELIDLELAVTTDGKARADLLCEKARILHDDLVRCEAAQACVIEALQTVNGHPGAAKLGKRLADEEAEWEKTAGTRLKQAKEAGNKTSAAPHYAVAGELYLRYRPKSQEGEAFLRKALEIDPKQRRADLLLERTMRSAERWDELKDLLARRAASATAADDKAAAEILAAEVASRQGKGADALEHFRKALQSSPAEPRALRAVVAALTEAQSFDELAKTYEAALKALKKGQGELGILVPLAQLTWKTLGNLEQAELHFRRLKKADPQSALALEFYKDYHAKRNEIPQLLALLTANQKAEPDPEKKLRLGIEMAEIAEQRPQSLEKAIDIWKSLLRAKPGLAEATTALRRLYTKAEKWNALLEMYKDEVEALPKDASDQKVALLLEMIPIYRDRLKLDVMVANTYGAILQLRPTHTEALRSLAEKHVAHGRWSDLVDLLGRQAAATEDNAEKVSLFHRVAGLWSEKLGKPQNAVAALEKVLELAPRDEAARAGLKDIHTRARNWRAVLDLLRRETSTAEIEAKRGLLGEMARLAAERLNDPTQAIALWNERLGLDAMDAEALRALMGLYEKAGRWPALCEVLGRLADTGDRAAAESATFVERRAALLSEKLGAHAAAEAALRALLLAQPDNASALKALRDLLGAQRKLDELEALYASRGAAEELHEAFNVLAERASDPTERLEILRRLARVAEEQLGQPERAISALEKIAALAPRDRAAALKLVALYRRTERWGRLLSTFEALLLDAASEPSKPSDSAEDAGLPPEERLALLIEARTVSESRLGSKAVAFQWASRAYALAPADGSVAIDLARLAADTGEWESYAAQLAGRLAQTGDAGPQLAERLGLLRRLLEACLGPLARPDDARKHAGAILALAPGDADAETALERLLVSANDKGELLRLWRERLARLDEGGDKLELLARVAAKEEEVGELPAAEQTLRSLLERRPDDAGALASLLRVAEARRDPKTIVEVLRKQLDGGSAADPLAALLRLGKLYESDLKDAAQAQAAYLDALELDPVAGDAVAGLERLLDAKAVPEDKIARVLVRLVPHYELTENYPRWAAALERLVELGDGIPEKLARLELLVDLYNGPLVDAAKAFQTALRMFDLEPRTFAVRERLQNMATTPETGEELGSVVRTVLARTDDATLRSELLGYLAVLEERRQGGGAVAAEKVYRELLKLDPLHGSAFRALTRLYQDAERWGDLRDLLVIREARIGEIHEKQKLLTQILELDEAVLDDHADALRMLERLLELNQDDMKLLRGRERHLAALERWQDLVDLLEYEETLVPAQDLPELRLRRAELLHRRLEKTGAAVDLCEEVLTQARGHAGVRKLLEEIKGLDQHRARVAVILEPIYEEAGEWAALVSILGAQVEASDSEAAAPLRARIAGLQESKLGDQAAALATWRVLLGDDATRSDALAEVERLSTLLDRHQDLADLYLALAAKQATSSPSLAADLLGRAARLQMTVFGDREATVRIWRRVMEIDQANPDIARPAVEALEGLYAQLGDFRGTVEILRIKVEWAASAPERSELLRRIAEIEERSLGDLSAAVTTLRALAEGNPDDAAPLVDLERLYLAQGQHRERVEVLRRQVELAPDQAARESLRFRMAGLLERELGDPDEAISVVVSVLDENPRHRGALEVLASLYEKKGAHVEHLEALERQLLLATEDEDRTELLRRMATLLQGPLAKPAEALERWQEVLAIAPRDPRAITEVERLLASAAPAEKLVAARTLDPIYVALGEWSKLAPLFEIYISVTDDPQERMALRERLAELQEKRLGQPAAAFVSFAAAIRDALATPALGRLLDAYERLAGILGPEQAIEVIDLYRSVEPDVLDDEARKRLVAGVATRAVRLGERPLAIEYYRRLLGMVPDDVAALDALAQLYREAGDNEAWRDILQRKADLSGSRPADEAGLRAQIGALAEAAGRRDDAIAAFERVYALRPDDKDAVAALDRLYTQAEQWSELCGLLERQLAATSPGPEAAALRYRLAEVHADRRGDKLAALTELGAVLKLDHEHSPTVAMLERLLKDDDVAEAAADQLEAIYIRRRAWPELVTIDELRLKRSEDLERRLHLTQRIARVYEEQIEDFDQAFSWYGRVFRETPTDRSAQEQLLRLAPKLDKWKELGRILDEYLADEPSNTDDVLEIVRLAAMIHDERLGDRAAARKHYRRAVEAAPGDAKGSRVFEAALERWQEWKELRDLLDEQISLLQSPSERVAYLRRSATLSSERLDDRRRAAECQRAILDLEPRDSHAASQLEALLRADQRWSDLREHLLGQLERAKEPADVNTLSFKLAEIEEARLDEVGQAIERYGEILTRTPRHPGALLALERRISDKEHRARVAQVLEPHFRRVQDAPKLAIVLGVLLETLTEVDKRILVFSEIALIEERLGRLDQAVEARGKAWLEDVASVDVLAALEATASSARLYPRYVEILAEGAAKAPDPDLQGALWANVATVSETRLGDAARAVAAWRASIAAKSDDEQAFVALERLLAQAQKADELADVVTRHLEIVQDAERRKVLTKRLAVLHEDALKQRDRAIEVWRSVLEIDDGDIEALDALARLYTGAAAWRDLAEILQRKIELTTDPAALRALRFAIARLHDEKLAEPAEAASHLRAVLDAHVGDTEALVALDRLFQREKQHTELLEILDLRLAAVPAGDPGRTELAFRAATLVEKDLLDPGASIDRYRSVLVLQPKHEAARRALWALAKEEDHRVSAIDVLEPILRDAGEWPQLIELLELRLGGETDPARRFDIQKDIAELREARLGDKRQAFVAWAAALAEQPGEAAAREALERLAVAIPDFAGLARTYEQLLQGDVDPELEQLMSWRVADICEHKLGEPAKAIEMLERLSGMTGQELPALGRLEVLLGRLERFEPLEGVLERQAELLPDDASQAAAFAKLGDLRAGRLRNREKAVEAYRSALERMPTHAGALAAMRRLIDEGLAAEASRRDILDMVEILEPFAEAREDHAELVRLFEIRVRLESDRAEASGWLRRIAEIAESRIGDKGMAVGALARALEADPLAGDTATEIERLVMALGRPAEGAQAIERAMAAVDPGATGELALRAARLYEAAAGAGAREHEGAAERLYLQVLSGDAENTAALEALEGLYRRLKDEGKLAGILERRGAADSDPLPRHQRYAEAARLRERLGDLAAAVADWQAVREAEEGDAEALRELARLYEGQGRAEDLVRVLDERSRFTDARDERLSLLRRMGELRRGPLRDPDGAAQSFRDLLDVDPGDRGALDALAAIEAERGDFSAYEEVLLRRVSAAASAAEKTEILLLLVRNAEERLEDADRAVGYLHQILEADPAHGAAFEGLRRIFERQERWHELLDLLEGKAALEAKFDPRQELTTRLLIADIWGRRIGDEDAAREAVEKVLAQKPDHGMALLQLAAIEERAEHWSEAAALLERAAAAAGTPSERAEVQHKRGQVLLAQGAPAGDVEACFLAALEADPKHRPSLEALEASARKAKDQARLAQLLDLKLAIGGAEPSERKAWLTELAALYSGPLGQPANAIPALRELAAAAPADLKLQEELGRALVVAGQIPEASQVLTSLLEALGKAKQPKAVARVQQVLGALAEKQGEGALALQRYEAAYQLDPAQPAVLAALGRLAMQQNDAEKARRYYRSLLLQSFDEKAVGVSKADVYLALGRLHVAAQEIPKARNMFERGLESDPKHAALKEALGGLPKA